MNIPIYKTQLLSAIKITNHIIHEDQITIYECSNPHHFDRLKKNEMAIYIFTYNELCLKVGKANSKSNARFCNHHYNPDSSKSNLAKSILSDISFQSLNIQKDNIGEWIRKNTKRINIIMDIKLGLFILNFVESFTQLYFSPKYEGHSSQRD